MSGSFQPLDTGDWGEQAYLKSSDLLFSHVLAGKTGELEAMLVEQGDKAPEFLLHRDSVGRSALPPASSLLPTKRSFINQQHPTRILRSSMMLTHCLPALLRTCRLASWRQM